MKGLDVLIGKIKQSNSEYAKDDIKTLQEQLERFPKYFNSVYKAVVSSETDRALRDMGYIDQEEFAFRTVKNDNERRTAHNSAIDACSIINRMCDMYGCDHICPDTEDRYVIADFIGNFVYNTYLEGQGHEKTFDQVVEAVRNLKTDPNHAVDEKRIRSDEWER